MHFKRPIIRLPIRFCADTLVDEVKALPQSAWVGHPQGLSGNDAVRLISPNGEATDLWGGEMAPTEYLRACPYIMEIMAVLGAVWGRSRLMGLVPGATVPPHIDSHYYWRTHVRIHIPVITNPDVAFTVGGETVHMEPGECWTFDSFQRHEVVNGGSNHRVHLVLDTVGGGSLWELMKQAQSDNPPAARLVEPGEGAGLPLRFERINSPKIMSPWEMRCHLRFLADQAQPHPRLADVVERLDRLNFEWGALWANQGPADEAAPDYAQLLAEAGRDLGNLGGESILLRNSLPLYHVLGRLVFEVAIAPAQPATSPAPAGFVAARSVA